ncbi:MAG: hypothetical protein FJ398_15495 [Verrucomicrobia bacterium]|nr:hypothetical protein [Verrucomicrobiota bacterium]
MPNQNALRYVSALRGVWLGLFVSAVLLAGCSAANQTDAAALAQEKAEIERLRLENQDLAKLQSENQEVQRLRKENQELFKLRAQYQELVRLRKENEQLKTQLAKAQQTAK